MSELKPCPFCGRSDVKRHHGVNETWFTCRYCDGGTGMYSDHMNESTGDIWNTRPIEESLQQKLAIAQEALEEMWLEVLWSYYNVGYEKESGMWVHSFMSDAEELHRLAGYDRETYEVNAEELKKRIPDIAKRQALAQWQEVKKMCDLTENGKKPKAYESDWGDK